MWQAIIPIIGTVIDKVIPDPAAAADAKLRAMELAQKGELAVLEADVQMASGQMRINEVEAASPDFFRGGWRPATGWCCVVGLLYQFLVQPILPWIVALFGVTVPPLPPINNEALFLLLTGMLGLGGLRSWERVRGKA